jgi:hypothetical protein
MAIKFSKGSDRERRGGSNGRNDRNRQESDNDEMDESGISEDDDEQVGKFVLKALVEACRLFIFNFIPGSWSC